MGAVWILKVASWNTKSAWGQAVGYRFPRETFYKIPNQIPCQDRLASMSPFAGGMTFFSYCAFSLGFRPWRDWIYVAPLRRLEALSPAPRATIQANTPSFWRGFQFRLISACSTLLLFPYFLLNSTMHVKYTDIFYAVFPGVCKSCSMVLEFQISGEWSCQGDH